VNRLASLERKLGAMLSPGGSRFGHRLEDAVPSPSPCALVRAEVAALRREVADLVRANLISWETGDV
jgi:hypothetical protein